jgi:hypothetical protein
VFGKFGFRTLLRDLDVTADERADTERDITECHRRIERLTAQGSLDGLLSEDEVTALLGDDGDRAQAVVAVLRGGLPRRLFERLADGRYLGKLFENGEWRIEGIFQVPEGKSPLEHLALGDEDATPKN